MRNVRILIVISLFIVCILAGCTSSSDLATQDVSSSVESGSSQIEESLEETEDGYEETEDGYEGTEDGYEGTEDGAGTITSEAAEVIALNDQGINRTDVKYIHSYEEHDGGTIVAWCVEFEVGNTQYSYYVDMVTGEILAMYVETH